MDTHSKPAERAPSIPAMGARFAGLASIRIASRGAPDFQSGVRIDAYGESPVRTAYFFPFQTPRPSSSTVTLVKPFAVSFWASVPDSA